MPFRTPGTPSQWLLERIKEVSFNLNLAMLVQLFVMAIASDSHLGMLVSLFLSLFNLKGKQHQTSILGLTHRTPGPLKHSSIHFEQSSFSVSFVESEVSQEKIDELFRISTESHK